ncbi:unnamed protein product [Trichobilharzia szidati]|nr:unnamed protein product [Trichobilharzia szidati]
MDLAEKDDVGVTGMLAPGNRAFFDMTVPETPARIVLESGNSEQMLRRMEQAEAIKEKPEFQFFQIKDELEKTRVKQYKTPAGTRNNAALRKPINFSAISKQNLTS